jgi:preprotein translocase subunit Sss1
VLRILLFALRRCEAPKALPGAEEATMQLSHMMIAFGLLGLIGYAIWKFQQRR